MSYPLTFSFPPGTGSTVTARLLDVSGGDAGAASVTSSFRADGWYAAAVSLPAGFRGFLAFAAGGVTVALFAVNPQEAENTDVKTSSVGGGGGGGGGASGDGAVSVTLTVLSTQQQPVPLCAVWVSTDDAGTNVVAGTLYTADDGTVTFLLDPGTYAVWRRHPTVTFVNPKRLTVTSP